MNSTDNTTVLFYAVNSVVHIGLSVFPVSALILCALIMVALAVAKDIKLKMVFLLIHGLTPDILSSIAFCSLYFGYPFRAFSNGEDVFKSCTIFYSNELAAMVATTLILPLLPIAIYVSVKYDMDKLKWWGIMTYIILTVIVPVALGIASGIVDTVAINSLAFCDVDLFGNAPVATYVVILLGLVAPLCFVLQILFSILSYCYVKKNTAVSSDFPTRAITKILLFEIIVIAGVFLRNMTVGVIYFQDSDVVLNVFYFASTVVSTLIVFATPVSYVVYLKPVRDALKQLCCRLKATGDL